jgi:hypothetical protein
VSLSPGEESTVATFLGKSSCNLKLRTGIADAALSFPQKP